MYKLKEIFLKSESANDYINGYLYRLKKLFEVVDVDKLKKAIRLIEKACLDRKTIYIIGNGGSAAVASHFINDLGPNSLVSSEPGFCVVSLTDNVESITAIANDSGFEHIFEYQLRSNMREGDLVIALSVSGNSENVIRGIKYAKEKGGITIGLTGFSGGKLKKICDLSIHVATSQDEYGPVEDTFSIFGHIISGYLSMKRGRNLHH